MGGACCICGYNKCAASLSMHHINPSQKKFGFAAIRANPKNWNTIIKELYKCILVCHNCHNEIHSGITNLPTNIPLLNEELLSSIENQANNLNNCPICDRLKSNHLINCSLECAGKARRKINWDKINLLEVLKIKSIVSLSEELNCSSAAIHKRLKKISLQNDKTIGRYLPT